LLAKHLEGGCMFKRAFYLGLFLCFACAFGASVSLETAQKVANNYLQRNGQSANLTLVKQKRADSPFFIFNKGAAKGYVIVAANDLVSPIFCDSDEGDYDENNMLPVEAYLMHNYENQISDAVKNNRSQDSETKARWEKYLQGSQTRGEVRAKTYLLATPLSPSPAGDIQWSQYWHADQTPIDPNTNQRSNAGCVATSMAQVVRYYGYPLQGKGTLPAHKPTGWANALPTVDHSKVNYDYSNMPGCPVSGTQAQKIEVGKLLANCGQSAYMNYATGESSTMNYNAATGLKNNFDYDTVIQPVYKRPVVAAAQQYALSDADWDDLIIGNIDNKAPLIVAGGGHSFILDGYDPDDGQFHANLGYGNNECKGGSGYSNKWYATSATGYGIDEMIINIMPNKNGNVPSVLKVTEFTASSSPVKVSAKVVFGKNFNGKIGLAQVSGGNTIVKVLDSADFSIQNEKLYQYRGGYPHTNKTSSATLNKTGYSGNGSDLKVVTKIGSGAWTIVGATQTAETTYYTIKFDSQGGNAVADVQVVAGTAYTPAVSPTPNPRIIDGKPHYFNGWFTDADTTNKWVNGTVINSNITLYAKWTFQNLPATVTVTFNNISDDNTLESVTPGVPYTVKRPDPTRDGYVFEGWYTDGLSTIPWVNGTVIYANTSLFAAWLDADGNKMPAFWKVEFETDGGSEVPVKLVSTANGPVAFSTDATSTKEGFIFGGWLTIPDSDEKWVNGTFIASDWKLFAQWRTDDGSNAISDAKKYDGRHGIIAVKNPVVGDLAEFVVKTPEKWTDAKLTIYDNLGNVVFSNERRLTISDDKMKWNLRNGNARAVAAGGYLAVVECKGANGTYRYYTKFGVKK